MSRIARSALWVCGVLAAPRAAAWEVAGEVALPSPGEATTLVAGPFGDGTAIALIGPSGTWVIDAATGEVRAAVARGGVTGALQDHDGDSLPDLVLCGPSGLSWARGEEGGFGAVAALTGEECLALATFHPEDGTRRLVTASNDLLVWGIGPDGALGEPERFGTRLSGPPLLVAAGARFAAATVGGTEIQERSEWGRSTYTARGPVAGLTAGPRSWAWSIPAAGVVADVTRREVRVAASAGALRHADLDGDGVFEVLVAHPDAVGVITNGVEVVLPVAAGVRDLAAADLDGDGCGEVVALQSDGAIRVLTGHCPADTVVEAGGAAVEVVLDERDRRVDAYVGKPLRVQLRDPLAQDTRFSGRGGPEGFGIAEDGLVTWIPEPDDVGEWSVSVRLWGGADLVRVVPIRLVVHLAADAGAGPGEPARVVIGDEWPTVQVLVGETAVLRLEDGIGEATTWRWRGGPRGLQIRADGLARYTAVVEDTGTWRIDLKMEGNKSGRRSGVWLKVAPRAAVTAAPGSPAAAEAERMASVARAPRFLQPRGCMVSLGLAGGVTATETSWETVGQTVYGSFSPVVAGTCEGGAPGGLQWFAGVDSAPLYAYVLNEDAIGVHTLAATIGFSFGSDLLRVGPYFSAGILLSGAGVRLWWVPFLTRGGIPHGFELRAAYLFASTPSGQAMILYGWRFGRPR